MQHLTILNSREVKRLKEKLEAQFGYSLQEEYAYLQNTQQKIFLINRDVAKIDLNKVIVDKMGLYFAELNDTEVRLSKEGAQLLWKEAQQHNAQMKNVVEFTAKDVRLYFAGIDLKKDLGGENRLVLLRYEDDVIGCAKYKEGKILNYMPKIHRGEAIV